VEKRSSCSRAERVAIAFWSIRPASIADRLWTMEEIAELIEAAAPKPGRPATYKKRAA
jgi:hypothetical protein